MAFSIENFSNYFCFVFSVPLTIPHELDLGRSQLGVEPETLSEVISNLYRVFWERFHMVIDELMVYKKSNARTFMERVLDVCMKISGKNPTYERFILVCTFINSIIEDSFEYTDCFIVPKVCQCVLVSLYRRCYKNCFDGKGKGNAFNFYIGTLKEPLAKQDILELQKKAPIFGKIYESPELKELEKEIEGVPLGNFEEGVLREMRHIAPVDFCDGRIRLSSSESSTGDSSENEPINGDSSENEPINGDVSENERINGDVSEDEPMYDDSLESKSKTTSGSDIHKDSSESKPSFSGRNFNKEDENEFTVLKRDYSAFKKQTCRICGAQCYMFMVSYVEKILGNIL